MYGRVFGDAFIGGWCFGLRGVDVVNFVRLIVPDWKLGLVCGLVVDGVRMGIFWMRSVALAFWLTFAGDIGLIGFHRVLWCFVLFSIVDVI